MKKKAHRWNSPIFLYVVDNTFLMKSLHGLNSIVWLVSEIQGFRWIVVCSLRGYTTVEHGKIRHISGIFFGATNTWIKILQNGIYNTNCDVQNTIFLCHFMTRWRLCIIFPPVLFFSKGSTAGNLTPAIFDLEQKPKFFRFYRTIAREVRRIFSICCFFAEWCTFKKKVTNFMEKIVTKLLIKKKLCNIFKKSYVPRWRKQFWIYCKNFKSIGKDLFELCFRPAQKKWFREKCV